MGPPSPGFVQQLWASTGRGRQLAQLHSPGWHNFGFQKPDNPKTDPTCGTSPSLHQGDQPESNVKMPASQRQVVLEEQ